ncbi:transcription cofactor vestigial-like protein 2b isoform X2 [Hypomesus transpacificus]|uniref:transcription cofactor vestigial-like protein 2b isoform X2 n=1 Tax=Hypomesus transpacificus TaxID=137520 RepID=UPI001F07147F|nr:transcription cofactor vestigial-like protein 2b isoform X2 [Hypomesus transpacificus]
MSCLDVMYPAYGHYAPYAPAAPAFINSLQAPIGLRSPSHQSRDLMDSMGTLRGPPDGVSGPSTGARSSSSSSSSSYPVGRAEDGGPKGKQETPDAEYLTSRCVLFTYYHGDISSVVDEHFSRALSSYMEGEGKRRAAELATDTPSPSSRRCFPPSFWDSNYPTPQSRPHCDQGAPHYSMDPYASGIHPGLPHPHPHPHAHPHAHPHPSEGWAYAQSQAYGPPRPLHELYSPSGLEPHYGSLLMPTVRPPHLGTLPGHYEVSKLEPTSAWPGLLGHADASQTLALNMDAGLQHHKKGKDLYWF